MVNIKKGVLGSRKAVNAHLPFATGTELASWVEFLVEGGF